MSTRGRVCSPGIFAVWFATGVWNENELFAIKRVAALSAPLVWDTTARVPSK